ncbi:helix-turn-helix transcriptional regulator [Calidifontibacillus oryziterrae]|uniref:helix-turn-helix transcriptional regulator n=1 Tax=Calidifontibacillus oryziterrae TaxID=1191699 RepID=UPI0002E443F5|nr:helix-turn-helix domain-containing protein [Calidifontibacillus oryziterrae]
MDKERLIEILSAKIKLIRTESGYTQDRMAEVLGISKKTLVQIEKGRLNGSWTLIVAVCALFRDSEVLQSVLGDVPLEVIETVAHDGVERPKDKTLGGKVWWKNIDVQNGFRIQQNLLSQHYRILDEENYRWYSSFSKEDTKEKFEELVKGK